MQNCMNKIPRYVDVSGMLQMFPSRAGGVGMPLGSEEAAAADKYTVQHDNPLSAASHSRCSLLKA